jgi:hypothetical protein
MLLESMFKSGKDATVVVGFSTSNGSCVIKVKLKFLSAYNIKCSPFIPMNYPCFSI